MKNESKIEKETMIMINHEKKLKQAFSIVSYKILQYLSDEDIKNLKLTNKYFNDISECHNLFRYSLKSLNGFFNKIIIDDHDNKPKQEYKKSKFKEKFNFNKSMNELYKHSSVTPPNRLKSSQVKKN